MRYALAGVTSRGDTASPGAARPDGVERTLSGHPTPRLRPHAFARTRVKATSWFASWSRMKKRFQPGPLQRCWPGFPAGGVPPAGTVLFIFLEVDKTSPVVMTGPALTRGFAGVSGYPDWRHRGESGTSCAVNGDTVHSTAKASRSKANLIWGIRLRDWKRLLRRRYSS